MQAIDRYRDEFRCSWRKWDRALSARDGLSDANDALDQAAQVTAPWITQERLDDLLTPLLSDREEPAVRFGAARYLLSRDLSAHRTPSGPVVAALVVLSRSTDHAGWAARVALQQLADTEKAAQ